MYTGRHVTYPLFFAYFNETLIFLTDFRKTLMSGFMKICPLWRRIVPCGRTDRRIDMTEIIVSFRSFWRRLKNCTDWIKLIVNFRRWRFAAGNLLDRKWKCVISTAVFLIQISPDQSQHSVDIQVLYSVLIL